MIRFASSAMATAILPLVDASSASIALTEAASDKHSRMRRQQAKLKLASSSSEGAAIATNILLVSLQRSHSSSDIAHAPVKAERCVQLRGPLGGRNTGRNQNAARVNCNAWFCGAFAIGTS